MPSVSFVQLVCVAFFLFYLVSQRAVLLQSWLSLSCNHRRRFVDGLILKYLVSTTTIVSAYPLERRCFRIPLIGNHRMPCLTVFR